MGSFGGVGGGGRISLICTLVILFYWITERKNCSSNQPDTCFALFKGKANEDEKWHSYRKKQSPVQTNFENEIKEKLLTLFKKKKA